jgi:DNA topoisomerase-6 subunit B
LGEVATAVSQINQADRQKLYDELLEVAKKKTIEADIKLDKHGRPVEEDTMNLGDNVIIVDPEQPRNDVVNRAE